MFTAENARANAAKSWERSESFVSARYKPKPKPIPAPEPQQTSTPEEADSTAKFRAKTLRRVREHLNLLQDKADTILGKRDMDMKEMRDLAVAIKELEGIEQRLSGRPGPGNLRPMPAKPPKRSAAYPEPIPQFSVIHEPTPGTSVTGDWETELF
jgi:hypothetical protein